MPLKKLKKKLPTNGIKSLADVKLEEECGALALVQSPCKVAHIQEIIMNTPLLDEGTLSI
jgi:hypothetical protein